MAMFPTLESVRAWISVPATVLDNASLGQVIAAEADKQAAYCTIPADPDSFPPALSQALYRRVARECAARGLPLGVTGDGIEYAPTRLPMWDAQIESHESPYRITALA